MITVFFINNLYYLLTKLSDFDALIFSEDANSFDKTFNNKIESYTNILVKKYFEEIHRILQNCMLKNSEVLETGRDTTREINKSILDPNELNMNKNEIEMLTKNEAKNELKNIAANFNSKYRDIFENVKKDISDSIKDKENSKMILKKFLDEIVYK